MATEEAESFEFLIWDELHFGTPLGALRDPLGALVIALTQWSL